MVEHYVEKKSFQIVGILKNRYQFIMILFFQKEKERRTRQEWVCETGNMYIKTIVNDNLLKVFKYESVKTKFNTCTNFVWHNVSNLKFQK